MSILIGSTITRKKPTILRVHISSTFSVLRPLYFGLSTSTSLLGVAYFDFYTSSLFVKCGFLIGGEVQVEVQFWSKERLTKKVEVKFR